MLLGSVKAEERVEIVGDDFNYGRRRPLNGEPLSSLDVRFGGAILPNPHGAATRLRAWRQN